MAEEQSAIEKFSAVSRDVVSTLRDAALVVVFVLLLWSPDMVRTRLEHAGFKEGSVAGFKWQAEITKATDQTKTAGQAVQEAGENYDQLIARLHELEAKVSSPEIKAAVQTINEDAQQSREQLTSADRIIKRSLATQQDIVAQLSPTAVRDSGWVYLGKVSEDKHTWADGSPRTIQTASPELARGTRLVVKDDVYLRADGPQNARATAAVLSVVKTGESLEVESVEYSHAKGGGWFIWAKVKHT